MSSQTYNTDANTVNPADGTQTQQTFTFKDHCKTPVMWAFIIVAIIVLVLLFLVIRPGLEQYSRMNKKGWTDANSVWGIIVTIVVLLFAYGSYYAYRMAPTDMTRQLIAVSFGVQMVLLLVVFYLAFRTQSWSNAFYLSIVVFLLALVHIYVVWKVSRSAGYASILYVLWTLLMVFASWGLSSDNQAADHKRHNNAHRNGREAEARGEDNRGND
jgi:tryptophan-rich sensory protein